MKKSERLQVPIDLELRREIEKAAKEQDSSCAQVMRTVLKAWQRERRAQRESGLRNLAIVRGNLPTS